MGVRLCLPAIAKIRIKKCKHKTLLAHSYHKYLEPELVSCALVCFPLRQDKELLGQRCQCPEHECSRLVSLGIVLPAGDLGVPPEGLECQ